MFAIKNNRLHYGGVSFGLPEGLYLDTINELGRENSIKFQDKDKTYSVELSFLTYEETAECYIQAERQRCIEADRFIYGDHHPDIKPIRQIKLNDLAGFVFLDGRTRRPILNPRTGIPYTSIFILESGDQNAWRTFWPVRRLKLFGGYQNRSKGIKRNADFAHIGVLALFLPVINNRPSRPGALLPKRRSVVHLHGGIQVSQPSARRNDERADLLKQVRRLFFANKPVSPPSKTLAPSAHSR